MKAGWERRRLGELCSIRLGRTPSRDVESYWDRDRGSGNVWVSIADMTALPTWEIADSKEYLTDSGAALFAPVPAGTLLVSFKLSLGRLAFAACDLRTNEAIAALTELDEGRVSKEFLYYALSYFDWQKAAEGGEKVKGKTLNKAQLEDLAVSFPPLPEQQRIVSILDEAFEGIEKAKANAERILENAREVFAGERERLFTECSPVWREAPLSALGSTITGSTPPSRDLSNFGDALPFIKPGDFRVDGSLEYDNEGLSEHGARRARVIPENSVLMVCIGATIGKAGVNERRVATNQQINALVPSVGVLNSFVYHQMLTRDFQKRVRINAGQATLPIINKSKWSALTVRVPPTLDEQQAVSSQLAELGERTRELQAASKRKLALLDELKKSLLHRAFAGEL